MFDRLFPPPRFRGSVQKVPTRRWGNPNSTVGNPKSMQGGQELKRCWVFSRPSEMRLSTASAAETTWKGSSLRSVVL